METGKAIRLQRIFRANRRALVVPLDHGVSIGPVEGLVHIGETVENLALGGADAVLLHKGLVPHAHRHCGRDMGLIVHLSASTILSPLENSKALVSGVEEALKLGADAVSVHVTLGDAHEREMLADLGRTVCAAHEWGLPVLAMLYARGPKIHNPFDAQLVAHCARIGFELGADVLKVPYTGSAESFAPTVQGVCVPVLIAGGEKMDSLSFLSMVHDALSAGAAGISIGRNVFQHPQPVLLLQVLCGIIHDNWSVERARAELYKD